MYSDIEQKNYTTKVTEQFKQIFKIVQRKFQKNRNRLFYNKNNKKIYDIFTSEN